MKLERDVLEFRPEHPFRIARSTERSLRRVRVRLRTEDGLEGWGEADPSSYYGEDAASVLAALDRMGPALEEADDPERLEALERELARSVGAGVSAEDAPAGGAVPAGDGGGGGEADGRGRPGRAGGSHTGSDGRAGHPGASDASQERGDEGADPGAPAPAADPAGRNPHAAARAAVSAALHDLQGKRLGRPLWRLWGLDPAEAPVSSFTLGIDDPEVMARKARAARGWPVLKVKLGVEREREEAILDAVRAEAPDAVLRVDANAGWTAEEALERIPGLAERGVEFVEQPLPPGDREGLRRVREGSPLPVVLDESCVVAADVPGLLGLADGVNVKLAKCGGPREALRAIHAARACGLKVMLGCMLETSLGIAPAAHLSPLVDWADLDGAHLLAEDPFRGPGPVTPGEAAGAESGPGAVDGAVGAAGGGARDAGAEPGRIVLGEEPGLGVTAR